MCERECKEFFEAQLLRFELSKKDLWELGQALANEELTAEQKRCLRGMGVEILEDNPKTSRREPPPPENFPPDERRFDSVVRFRGVTFTHAQKTAEKYE